MQQGAAKKPYSVSAHENEAVFVNDLLYTDESELKDLNQNEFIERVITVAKPADIYQGQLQQTKYFLKEAKSNLTSDLPLK